MSLEIAREITSEHSPDGFKDTLESIVVALILAFIFRAFIVEAFVIPTGSMAPTLYGAHGTIVCSDCGWEFAYGLRDSSEAPGIDLVTPQSRAICPNCAHPNTQLTITDAAKNPESGDRILVLKWPFDLGGSYFGPARWDVTVFKNPADGVQNYIKRLTGMPNEVLMIVDGDVYVTPVDGLSQETVAELEWLRHQKFLLQNKPGRERMDQASDDVLKELAQKLKIARKSPAAQRNLWFIVYDHDHVPRSIDTHQPKWVALSKPDSSWDTSTRRIRFDGLEADAEAIELRSRPIAASYAYNLLPNMEREQPPLVSDQRIRFVLTPHDDKGILRLRLAKGKRVFWASIHMDGLITLTESPELPNDRMPSMVERRLNPFKPDQAVSVCLENVDYRLALSIDGKEVLTSSAEPASRAFYAPDLNALLRSLRAPESLPPRVYAQGTRLDLSHLVVERDIYYYNTQAPPGWKMSGGWGTAGNPILLREGEYFMMGDNSPASQDSRLWGDISKNRYLLDRGEDFQLGTVPNDQLIGKAFFVYWPSPNRASWLPLPKGWGIIPDVGRMRWIH